MNRDLNRVWKRRDSELQLARIPPQGNRFNDQSSLCRRRWVRRATDNERIRAWLVTAASSKGRSLQVAAPWRRGAALVLFWSRCYFGLWRKALLLLQKKCITIIKAAFYCGFIY